MLPVAILAGGLATRIRPITDTIPKQLVEVAGEPFAYHQLRALHATGVRKAVFCVGYRGEQIVEAVGSGERFGVEVDYVFDGPTLLGTAGALRQALPRLGEAFFVLYGDSYLQIDYAAVEAAFAAARTPALMTVFRNEGRWDTSNVAFTDDRIKAYSKRKLTSDMAFIDYGLGVVRSEIFTDLPTGKPSDLADLYESLAELGLLTAYEARHRFYEIGSFDGIRELEIHLEQADLRRAAPATGVRALNYVKTHLDEAVSIIGQLDHDAIESVASGLAELRHKGGRLFFLGVGGSAGNCSHAVNDFRKIVGIEAYAPTDNVSELTARTNDEGWHTVFSEWLKISKLDADDALFIFSVGGGNAEKNISPNLVSALDYAKSVGAKVYGVVGRDGGYTAKVGDHVVIIPTVNPETITPHSEAFQAVVWHLLVSHPSLKARDTKWESAVR